MSHSLTTEKGVVTSVTKPVMKVISLVIEPKPNARQKSSFRFEMEYADELENEVLKILYLRLSGWIAMVESTIKKKKPKPVVEPEPVVTPQP